MSAGAADALLWLLLRLLAANWRPRLPPPAVGEQPRSARGCPAPCSLAIAPGGGCSRCPKPSGGSGPPGLLPMNPARLAGQGVPIHARHGVGPRLRQTSSRAGPAAVGQGPPGAGGQRGQHGGGRWIRVRWGGPAASWELREQGLCSGQQQVGASRPAASRLVPAGPGMPGGHDLRLRAPIGALCDLHSLPAASCWVGSRSPSWISRPGGPPRAHPRPPTPPTPPHHPPDSNGGSRSGLQRRGRAASAPGPPPAGQPRRLRGPRPPGVPGSASGGAAGAGGRPQRESRCGARPRSLPAGRPPCPARSNRRPLALGRPRRADGAHSPRGAAPAAPRRPRSRRLPLPPTRVPARPASPPLQVPAP